MCDLKAVSMNVQRSSIRKLMPFKFKLGHNAAEAAKNISWAKYKDTVDPSTVTRWFKKFYSACKNHIDQTRSRKLKTVNFEAVLEAIEPYPVCSTRRVSGELGIIQFSVVCDIYDRSKTIRRSQIVFHMTKILQNVLLALRSSSSSYLGQKQI